MFVADGLKLPGQLVWVATAQSQRKERRRTRFLYTLALRMCDAKSTAESAATKPQLVTSVISLLVTSVISMLVTRVVSLLVTSEISLHRVHSAQWPEYSAWHHLALSGS